MIRKIAQSLKKHYKPKFRALKGLPISLFEEISNNYLTAFKFGRHYNNT